MQNLEPSSPVTERSNGDEVKNELQTIFVIVCYSQGQSISNRQDADLRSVMQSREESLREVEKLVQHTETLERKYTDKVITTFAVIIKFPYNARSDWLKQRSLSENKVQVNDIKLLSNFCFGISTNLTQIKHPLCESDKVK